MTMPIKIDTLEYAKRLAEAGLPTDQAEAQAHALSDVLSEAVVSPSELVLLKADLMARMELLRHEMRNYIDELGVELHHRIDALGVELNHKIDALGIELHHRIDGLEARIDRLEAQLSALAKKFDTLKWMIGGMLVLQAVLVIKVFWVA